MKRSRKNDLVVSREIQAAADSRHAGWYETWGPNGTEPDASMIETAEDDYAGLSLIADWVAEGDLPLALRSASLFDTEVRESIPARAWAYIGGELLDGRTIEDF